MSQIKNIIFDFGGVLLNLDESITRNKFNEILDPEKCKNIHEEVFYPYERGEISEESFFNRLQRRSIKVLNGEIYYEIWNAMLLDFPQHRLDYIIQLRKRYKLILLSNTNITHIRNVLRRLKLDLHVDKLEDYFDHIFYSHDIHLRKPDPEIFKFVLQDAHINAEESLYIDDKIENTTSAASLGFNVHHHDSSQDISSILEEILIKLKD